MNELRFGRRAALRLQVVGAIVLLLQSLWGGAAPAAADGPGELIIQPAPGVTIEQVNALLGTKTLLKFTDSTQALVWTPVLHTTLSKVAGLLPLVAWAEPNVGTRVADDSGADPHCPTSSTSTSSTAVQSKDDSGADTRCTQVVANGAQLYRDQWGVTKISLAAAQAKSKGSGVTIAVLDTRVDRSHPVLSGRALAEIDLVSSDPQANVGTTGRVKYHGTFVAGVALRSAPEAKVLPVRVLNDDGSGTSAIVAEGIRRAAANGARVINMSLSTSYRSKAMQDAVTYARGKGSVLVAAYGNDGAKDPEVYPANFAGVLSVVATDESDRRASFSNYGWAAKTAAPGVNIIGPYPGGQYAKGNGTSYAAPWVAGEAALLLAKSMSPKNVESQVVKTADNISTANGGSNPGYGRINTYRSLTATN